LTVNGIGGVSLKSHPLRHREPHKKIPGGYILGWVYIRITFTRAHKV